MQGANQVKSILVGGGVVLEDLVTAVEAGITNLFNEFWVIDQGSMSDSQIHDACSLFYSFASRIVEDVTDAGVLDAEDLEQGYNNVPLGSRQTWQSNWSSMFSEQIVASLRYNDIYPTSNWGILSLDPPRHQFTITVQNGQNRPHLFMPLPWGTSETAHVSISYGNTQIGSITGMDSRTLLTAGKVLTDNIVCTASGEFYSHYDISFSNNGGSIYSGQGSVTLLTSGKYLDKNIVVAMHDD